MNYDVIIETNSMSVCIYLASQAIVYEDTLPL